MMLSTQSCLAGFLVLSSLCVLEQCRAFSSGSGFSRVLSPSRRPQASPASTGRSHSLSTSWSRVNMKNEKAEQSQEALQSLGDFHQGSWKGHATSFTVTADVAAGIVLKKKSPEYQVDIQLSYNPRGRLSINEVYSWQNKQGNEQEPLAFASTRSLDIADSSVDVDAVDASYSLHQQQQQSSSRDSNDDDEPSAEGEQQLQQVPVDLTGTEKPVEFAVEQCIAVSDDERVRMLALYGVKQDLIRVVVCNEQRVPSDSDDDAAAAPEGATPLTVTDLLEMQTDVDRIVDKIAGQIKGIDDDGNESNRDGSLSSPSSDDRLQQLQESIAKAQSKSAPQTPPTMSTSKRDDPSKRDDQGPLLSRHPMSLLELTSGAWLGDSIIRDFPTVPGELQSASTKGKGFGASKKGNSYNDSPPPFGSWAVGVQKVARDWLWDFGEEVRENNSAGKCMGAMMEPALSQSRAGQVCENQSLSRRIPKEERMVYIDWNNGNNGNSGQVGFLLGSVSIQVPRYLTFGENRKAFYTELCVYQSTTTSAEDGSSMNAMSLDDDSLGELPEVICSRICRLYNTEGLLKQGCTSFYTLKRFGPEGGTDGR
ncbi:expressed unknown protein [Seminavis robusta]|uniref:Uncharacterized protein n=1 Tax=Seminavis robusta TaxID=568900 RepID=A0A9N8DUZ7_9STRA|nr:expressed unknown protein [Seminavis robusta]|eukprot:Sro371_g128640.1 n/a (593) ;mRNA; f:64218-66114